MGCSSDVSSDVEVARRRLLDGLAFECRLPPAYSHRLELIYFEVARRRLLDGFSVSWKRQSLFLNPPWSAIPRVLHKIQEDRAQGVLVIPFWPSQAWWPLALRLRARWVRLPPPRECVLPLHGGPVEPFAHFTTRLVALVFDATSGWKTGTPTLRMLS